MRFSKNDFFDSDCNRMFIKFRKFCSLKVMLNFDNSATKFSFFFKSASTNNFQIWKVESFAHNTIYCFNKQFCLISEDFPKKIHRQKNSSNHSATGTF